MALATSSADRAVVGAAVSLAHDLGLEVVVEGVEDQASLELLRGLGADLAQGYHLCRPVPAPDLTRWLRSRCARPALPAPPVPAQASSPEAAARVP